jgi:hypothetical protein
MADGPGDDDSAGINKAPKNDWIQPEPAPVPRDVFAGTQPAGALLVAADWFIGRRKMGHE